MKNLLFTLALVSALFSSSAQTVKFNTDKPVAGKSLSFTYNPSGGKLEKLADVTCVAYTFINTKQKVLPVPLRKVNGMYEGEFVPADSTAIAVLVFKADGTKDENPNGYYTLFYSGDKPTAMAYYWESQYFNGLGNYFGGAAIDKARAITSLENAFAVDAKLKDTYGVFYVNLQYSQDKAKGEKIALGQIAALNAIKSKSEKDYAKMASLYNAVKKKSSADSVNNVVKLKYPKGNYAYNLASNVFYREKNAAKKEEQLKAITENFGLNDSKKADVGRLEELNATLAETYGEANNPAKFEFYANKVTNKVTLASLYNGYAWPNAEKRENTVFATQISKKSLDLLTAAKNDLVPASYASKEDYHKSIDASYLMFADTYALLLHNGGNTKEALKYQQMAVEGNKFVNAEMNARYVTFLAMAGEKEKTIKFAEQFIKDGQGTPQMKADLQSVYSGETPFDTYYSALDKIAVEKERAKLQKEMLSMEAPEFSLKNLKGEAVSLASLRGKVVVVDFWATWCGPCIASFPGMQKAVDKFKSDANVAFVFINTWQNEENREKVVNDFVAANPYTFDVLLDTKNEKDATKFNIVDRYKVDGIPTKFIIDPKGIIRFKKVGGSSNIEGVVREMSALIDMAKTAGK